MRRLDRISHGFAGVLRRIGPKLYQRPFPSPIGLPWSPQKNPGPDHKHWQRNGAREPEERISDTGADCDGLHRIASGGGRDVFDQAFASGTHIVWDPGLDGFWAY